MANSTTEGVGNSTTEGVANSTTGTTVALAKIEKNNLSSVSDADKEIPTRG